MEKYSFKDRLSIVHWGGDYRLTTEDYLYEGANEIWKLGVRNIKIYLGRKTDKTYFTSYKNKTPASIAQQDNYQRVFRMGWRTVVLVCHANVPDSGGSTYWKYSSERLQNYLIEESYQMSCLANILGEIKDVKFIITNWEGDCMVNRDKTPDVYSKMAMWINARQIGIDEAKCSNVKHGIEVNFVRQSLVGYPSVLTKVVPHTKTDYISYSCYDCLDKKQFEECAILINKITQRPLIIGEFGSPVNKTDQNATLDYISGISDIVEKYGIEICCYWQIYDNEFDEDGSSKGFGLIDSKGYVTGIWGIFAMN